MVSSDGGWYMETRLIIDWPKLTWVITCSKDFKEFESSITEHFRVLRSKTPTPPPRLLMQDLYNS